VGEAHQAQDLLELQPVLLGQGQREAVLPHHLAHHQRLHLLHLAYLLVQRRLLTLLLLAMLLQGQVLYLFSN